MLTFFVGLAVGCFVGFVAAALCTVAHRADEG